MNRIAASFLSGWVLMLPPVTENKSGFEVDLHAPYSRWDQFLAFDTAKECSTYKIRVYNAGMEYLRHQQAEWDRIAQELNAKYPDAEAKRIQDIAGKLPEERSEKEWQMLIDFFKADRPRTAAEERAKQEFLKRTQHYDRSKHAAALAKLDARCVPAEVVFPTPKR